jgi:hypothetical protein
MFSFLFKKCLSPDSVAEDHPKVDHLLLANQYVQTLPKCRNEIIVASPNYNNEHYTCELKVSSSELQVWAAKSWKSFVSPDSTRISCLALSIWLENTTSSEEGVFYMPQDMYDTISWHIPTHFITWDSASVYCSQCEEWSKDTNTKGLDGNSVGKGGWCRWENIWTCKNGHQLYYEKQEVHFYCG